jgi:hypothetical protein
MMLAFLLAHAADARDPVVSDHGAEQRAQPRA